MNCLKVAAQAPLHSIHANPPISSLMMTIKISEFTSLPPTVPMLVSFRLSFVVMLLLVVVLTPNVVVVLVVVVVVVMWCSRSVAAVLMASQFIA